MATCPDPLTEEEWLASLDAMADEDEPPDGDELEDPPPLDCDWDQITAQCRQVAEDQARAAARLGLTGALAAVAALNGRRGPGQPGSAQVFPGEYRGPGRGSADRLVGQAAEAGRAGRVDR